MISAACVQLICLPTARKLPLESSLPAPMPGSDTVPTQSPFRLEKHLSYPRSCWTEHFTCYKHRTDHRLATLANNPGTDFLLLIVLIRTKAISITLNLEVDARLAIRKQTQRSDSIYTTAYLGFTSLPQGHEEYAGPIHPFGTSY